MKTTIGGMVQIDPVAEQEKRRACCVDDRVSDVLTTFGFFPGDYVEVDVHGLTAIRKRASGETVHSLGQVDKIEHVRHLAARWFAISALGWTEIARAVAHEAHGAQLYGTEPYIVHLDEVYAVLDELELAGGAIGPAAILHDTIEDSKGKVTRPGLEAIFGYEVARLVDAISKEPAPSRAAAAAASNVKIREACLASGNGDAATVKLSDRFCNVRRSKANRPDLFAMYRDEQPAFWATLRGWGDPRLWVLLDRAFAL